VFIKIVIALNMVIQNCNCSNTSATTSCGCHNPIELISQGLTGPQGPTGPTGTSGTTVLFSSVVAYDFTTGLTGETITLYTIDNTPTAHLANGDYLKIWGLLRYSNTLTPWRAIDTVINIGALTIALPRRQANQNVYTYDYFEIYLKRITSTTCAYVAESSSMINVGANWDTLTSSFKPSTSSAVINFTTDLIVSVTCTEMDLTTTPPTAIALEATASSRIQHFHIEKYKQ
jgi:hypothetical protein